MLVGASLLNTGENILCKILGHKGVLEVEA